MRGLGIGLGKVLLKKNLNQNCLQKLILSVEMDAAEIACYQALVTPLHG